MTGGNDTNQLLDQHGRRLANASNERGVGLLELTATLAISAIVASSMLTGLDGLSHRVKQSHALEIARDAVTSARRHAYLHAGTVAVRATKQGFLVEAPAPGSTIAFDLPGGFIVKRFTRSGVIRFFGDGLSDNASITIGPALGNDSETLFIDARGEIR
jgi:type II secretory pathway pseudopilin PulG